MKDFIPGLELSDLFYQREVKPILAAEFKGLHYSAALIGHGSEVLGLDTPQSTDHDWGPRVIIFLAKRYFHRAKEVSKILGKKLPRQFLGYSVSPDNISSVRKGEQESRMHRIEITTIRKYFEEELGINPYAKLDYLDWLTFPQESLLPIISGRVFHDGLGELKTIRKKFEYYPHDVWLFMLASQWDKIGQEEPRVGRTGDVGDELGSQVIAGRIVKEIMKLCFLMERQYNPYDKWFGTAFLRLSSSKLLHPILKRALLSKTWKEREGYLARAYEFLAKRHNNLKITKPLNTHVSNFFGRPYKVINAGNFAQEIKMKIKNSKLKKMKLLGAVDQFTDSIPLGENPKLFRALKGFLSQT